MILKYFRDGGSDKHLRDIASILLMQGSALDLEYLEQWSKTLNVDAERDWCVSGCARQCNDRACDTCDLHLAKLALIG